MTPPHVPGIPGARLPEPWEKPLADLEKRVARLEEGQDQTRRTLQSYSDEEEDSQVKIPSDAPPKLKGALGALQGIPPNQRGPVLVMVCGMLFALIAFVVLKVGKFW